MDKTEPAFNVSYRNVKHPRLEFKTGTLLIVLPKDEETPEQILEKYRKWIDKKQKTIKAAIQQANTKSLNKTRTEKQLKALVSKIAKNSQTELNTRINKIFFKKMKTKWASHSKNNNLTVNTLLKYLPNNLIKYIIHHEIAHSLERKHNQHFWALIERKYPDHNAKEKDLLTYWFIIQKIQQ